MLPGDYLTSAPQTPAVPYSPRDEFCAYGCLIVFRKQVNWFQPFQIFNRLAQFKSFKNKRGTPRFGNAGRLIEAFMGSFLRREIGVCHNNLTIWIPANLSRV